MRIQPRRFSESPNQNTRGTWCVSAVLLRYVSAIRLKSNCQGCALVQYHETHCAIGSSSSHS